MYKIMTAGPTQVRENVRMARSLETTNPDLDVAFVEFYKETCDKLQSMLHCSGRAYILGGEGILGLEAACASLTEPGDRVLVLDNGIFGKGFADFVTMYGGEAVLYTSDYQRPIDAADLRSFLEKDSDFKYATVVHCDTPSGVLNDVSEICPLLAEFGILWVVDSVAGMFGEYLNFDESKIDILCGPAPVFFGYGMRAQICRHNAYLMAIGKPFYHIKLLKLVGLVKPIAAFYLNGCNALAHKLVKEAHAPFKKLVFARAPCGPYG